MKQLYTKWGEALKDCNDPALQPLPEYPRPSMVRNSYENLNGWWEYAITSKEESEPDSYQGKILVPFSPETALSGVGRQLQPYEYLWYRCSISFDREKITNDMKLLLHFGAIDQSADIYIDGKSAGSHQGGYLPFTIDLTPFCRDRSEDTLTLVLRVSDVSDTSYHARGKQKLKRGGMYYTAQSGIWQTVWMEYVPKISISSVSVTADADNGNVNFAIILSDYCAELSDNANNLQTKEGIPVAITIYEASDSFRDITDPAMHMVQFKEKKEIASISLTAGCSPLSAIISIDTAHLRLWDTEHPYLYDYRITVASSDEIAGYFALRSFTKEMDEAQIPRLCLNHKVLFQEGVLDQGYWPESLLTPPSDAAFLFDIQEMKNAGFNMIRKHIKIEPQRFYFHCDRLGMIVWQDMVNGGTPYKDWYVTYLATVYSLFQIHPKDTHSRLLSRRDAAGKEEWMEEMKATIALLKHHPCISTWVIFNEGWGQFETEKMVDCARGCDPTRFLDAASGWYDQGCGDMNSFHNYFFPMVIPRDKKENQRAAVLSEYGGYSYAIEDHCTTEDMYGYGTYKDSASLKDAYDKRRSEAMALIPKGLCATVYTQVSDIEDEVNGIYTYDRKIKKF